MALILRKATLLKARAESKHSSKPLLPKPIDPTAPNLQGKEQKHIPFGENKVRLPRGATKTPIPESQQTWEQPSVKSKIDSDNK